MVYFSSARISHLNYKTLYKGITNNLSRHDLHSRCRKAWVLYPLAILTNKFHICVLRILYRNIFLPRNDSSTEAQRNEIYSFPR